MTAAARTGGTVRVEDGSARDLGDVIAIMAAAFDPAFGEAWTHAQCAGILPMSGVALRIARSHDGAALGFSLFRAVAGEAELLLLAINPEHRRVGLGRLLLQDFVSRATQKGATRVHLEVRANNPAIELYASAGFQPVGRRQHYYTGADGSRYDALTFALSLK